MNSTSLLTGGLVIASLYAALVLVAFAFQNQLLFLPSSDHVMTPPDMGLSFEDVRISTSDGERLHGWMIRALNETRSQNAEDPARTILFFHGNAGNISSRVPLARGLAELGYDVLLVDYRGYGRSTGRPTEEGLYEDARAAWQYLTTDRSVPEGDIIIYGRSLGGGPAAWLATQVQARALVLESTFTSVPDIAAHHYPFLPVRWLSRIRFDTASRVGQVGMPVHIIHGRNDEVVPFEHGEALHASARSPKSFTATGDSHNQTSMETTQARAKALRAPGTAE